MTAVVIGLLLVLALGCVCFLRRNTAVYRERSRVIRLIHEANLADIEAGRFDYHWRYEAYEAGPSYEAMAWQLWRPVGSFFDDDALATPQGKGVNK